MPLAYTGKSPLASDFHLRLQAKTQSADEITVDNISVKQDIKRMDAPMARRKSREKTDRTRRPQDK
jgi:hypothetical protein